MKFVYLRNKKVIDWRRKCLFLVIVTIFLSFPISVLSSDRNDKKIRINWTDTGVYMGKRPEHLKRPDDFMLRTFPDAIQPVFPDIGSEGQILIPMPKNEDFPKNQADWQGFTSKLYEGIKRRIDKGVKEGIDNFEIRTVQNITVKGGYWVPWQQEKCVGFTKSFLEALSKVKSDLSRNYRVDAYGVVGSNGGYVAAEAVPQLSQNPLDKLMIIDGRAYVDKVVKTSKAMNGNVVLINTGGDASAFPDMVANHKGAKFVKSLIPRVKSFYVDPKGWNIPGRAHLAAMNPDTEMWVKEFTGEGYTSKTKMMASELLENLLVPHQTTSLWTYSGRSSTLTEIQIMTDMVRGKKKALVVGTGSEANLLCVKMIEVLGHENVKKIGSPLSNVQLQVEAKKFGADAILGVKEYKLPKLKDTFGRYGTNRGLPEDYHTGPTWPGRPNRPCATYEGAEERFKEALKHSHDINKARNPGAYGFPGKPGSFIPTDIGGVMLQGVADVSDATDAGAQLTDGTFSLIFQNANAEIDIGKLRKFVTALWAVYFSEEGPGISIDPIAPGVDKHLVRYIGRKVINSDLGRVMREADYAMKKWAVGIERPGIDGFKSVDALTAQHGLRYLGASRRFWFVPEDMRFKRAGDALLFDSGEMTLKTEYVFLNKGVRAEPADKEFARSFTKKYDQIAEKYPIYRELFEYAKLVSLARYLKDKGIPMLWFLLANKDMVITENSPGTVDALAKKSDYYEYITIEGGVDLDIKSSEVDYVFDMEATKAINKAYKLYGTNSLGKSSVLPSESITFETKDNDFTLTPSHILALSNGTVTGDKYQTDIAIRYGKGPGLELARYYNPEYKGPATFGKGWHLLIPYRIETHGKGKIEFGNAIISEKIVVKNLLTGRKEVLAFSKDRYSIAGYVPDDLENSSFIGLFLLSDASFRLADKLGNEFQFNQGGHLTEMVFSKEYHVKLEYGYAESKKEGFNALPYRIEPVTDKYEEFLNIRLPKNMRVVDVINGKEEVFVFNNKNKYKIAGYTPLNENNSKYKILAIMTDGSYDLIDKQGNEVSFDPAGRLNRIRARVIKGLSQGNYKIKFDYEFNNGGPGIKEAHVLKGDQSTALYAMKYEYDNDGRLSKVLTPAGKDMEIKYDEQRVIVAMK